MKKFVIITIVLLLLSCTPKYIYEYEYQNGIIIDKEMYTDLWDKIMKTVKEVKEQYNKELDAL